MLVQTEQVIGRGRQGKERSGLFLNEAMGEKKEDKVGNFDMPAKKILHFSKKKKKELVWVCLFALK